MIEIIRAVPVVGEYCVSFVTALFLAEEQPECDENVEKKSKKSASYWAAAAAAAAAAAFQASGVQTLRKKKKKKKKKSFLAAVQNKLVSLVQK